VHEPRDHGPLPAFAAALKYERPRDPAPRVTALGRGEIARRIIEEARRAGVPIREDADLVAVLLQLDLHECIPPSLYQVVAELLLVLYHANDEWKRRHGAC